MVVSRKKLQEEDTVALARWLLGKALVARRGDGLLSRRAIAETEAYHGFDDKASHASRGRTPRNEPMFAAGGVWYVYLCYGVHEMLNIATGPEGFPAAILIRGLEDLSGPGRLTNALDIDRRFNAKPAGIATGLWIEDDGIAVPRRAIRALPRIGVAYAGPVWSVKPWRFVWDGRKL
ncbi:MAG: DNA-3-methyladenine glycosylase [Opitutaceae bacterium]|jgi:DNA-3-methyladenine glycosylase